MGACYQSYSRILVWNFEFFGRTDHHLSHHHSHVCSFLDTFWYICFVIAFCRLQYIPNFNCSKFYRLYSVPLVSIFSSYLPHLSFFLPFLFTIIVSVPFSLVLARILLFFYKHMYTLHHQKKQKTRYSPGTKICKGCLGLIK